MRAAAKQVEVVYLRFQEGALIRRSLFGRIAKCGLLTLGAPLSVKQLYGRYRLGSKRQKPLQHPEPKHGSRPGTSVLKASMKPPSTWVTKTERPSRPPNVKLVGYFPRN